MNIHPRIAELAEEYIREQGHGNENLQAYEKAWLETSANSWYHHTLLKIDLGSRALDNLTDKLCAEIGFWRGVDMLHRARKGEPFVSQPYRSS